MRKILFILSVVFGSSVINAQANFNGGNGCGYNSIKAIGLANYSYRGGSNGGNAMIVKDGLANYSYRGGNDDGYAFHLYRTPFIWTGTIGTSWTVQGNWNYNLIPGIYRPVIIPAGVPNWPFINAGLLNIGDNPNNGGFRCASLWIQENALLVTRVNNSVENYGLITIDGTFQMKKQTPGAFKNLAGGVIIINQGGELKIKP